MWAPVVRHVGHERPYILRRDAATLLEATPLDTDQKSILKALTPKDGFNENTDWNAERMKQRIKIVPKTKGM